MSRNVLITGCSTGFGFDAAKRFADAGWHVYATMRDYQGRNAPASEALDDYADQHDLMIDLLELDVTSDDSVRDAIEGLPAMDVVINNAGLGYGGPVESFTSAEILRQLDVNLVGCARVSKAVLPQMREAGKGLIINVSSTAGRGAFPGFGVYHASKWGLEGMSEAMRYELSPLGVDVCLVEPGPFATNFFGNMVSGSDTDAASAYPHLGDFQAGFVASVEEAFENPDAPTDAGVVVDIFLKLADMPAGTRPLRTNAGLDFGFQALNDAVEPIRQGALEMMGISEWDGPKG